MTSNIVLLIIDGLRGDTLLNAHNEKKFKYGFRKILDDGSIFTNVYSNGNPTQTSLSSFFTSSLPLDDEGYDLGLQFRRKKSFVEILHANNYTCSGIGTVPWNSSFYKFNKGYDYYIDLFSPNLLIGPILNGIYSRPKDIKSGSNYDSYLETLHKYFSENLVTYFKNQVKMTKLGFTNDYLNLKNLHIYQKLLKDKDILEIENCVRLYKNFPESLTESKIKKIMSRYINFIFRKLYIPLELLCPNDMIYFNYIIKKTIPQIFDRIENHHNFLSLHITDLHELRYKSPIYINKKDFTHFYYIKSLEYIDKKLDDFIDLLNNKFGDDFLLVLTGDHGSYYARPNSGYKVQNNHDSVLRENVRTFLGIYGDHRSFGQKSELVSLLDVAPTLLGLAGLHNYEYLGRDLLRPHEEIDGVIVETRGPGPGFKFKPATVSLINKKSQLIFREEITSSMRETDYNIRFESNLPFKDAELEFHKFQEIIAERIKIIRED